VVGMDFNEVDMIELLEIFGLMWPLAGLAAFVFLVVAT